MAAVAEVCLSFSSVRSFSGTCLARLLLHSRAGGGGGEGPVGFGVQQRRDLPYN